MGSHLIKGTKYYKYVYSSGSSAVGSPNVDSAGLATGFSNSDYLRTPNYFNPTGTFEIVMCVKPNANQTPLYRDTWKNNQVLGIPNGYYGWVDPIVYVKAPNVNLKVSTDKIYLELNASTYNSGSTNIGTIDQTVSLDSTKFYDIKITFNGSQYTLAYREHSTSSYTTLGTITSSTVIGECDLLIGHTYQGVTGTGSIGVRENFFEGVIDLLHSYININNQVWWQNKVTEEITQTEYEQHIGDADYFMQQSVAVKDYLVSQKKYSKKAGFIFYPNYDVIGSISVTNLGVANGFSRNNYIQLPKQFPIYDSMDIIIKFDFQNQTDHTGILTQNSSNYTNGFGLSYKNANQAQLQFLNNWSSNPGSSLLQKGNTYWIRCIKNSGINSWTLYSLLDNGGYTLDNLPELNNWTNERTTTTNPFPAGYSFIFEGYLFTGWAADNNPIDLFNSQIMLDGSIWWNNRVQPWQECTKAEYDTLSSSDRRMENRYLAEVGRKYLKKVNTTVESSWTQPVLSANGTIGGDSFAVYSPNVYSYDTYLAFDNSASTYAGFTIGGTSSIIMYNPTPLKVSNIHVSALSHRTSSGGTVYGSNDNSTWTELTTYTNNQGNFDINISTQDTYKYIKLTVTAKAYNYAVYIYEIQITATEQTGGISWQECTKAEYDQQTSSNRRIENRYSVLKAV